MHLRIAMPGYVADNIRPLELNPARVPSYRHKRRVRVPSYRHKRSVIRPIPTATGIGLYVNGGSYAHIMDHK